jgi:GT2 family glycosyltransferase
MPSPLAIVVVNFNKRDYLVRCLQSLRREAPPGSEIVVVDNASQDGAPDLVRERFPEVRLIANSENRGFSAANNQGVAVTTAPWVLLLNNDTEVLPGSLAHLAEFAEAHGDAGAIGCTLLRTDGTLHRLPASIFTGLYWFPERVHKVAWIVGAALLLRRSALDAVGGLDEGFFFYYEDWDLGLRLRKAGWRSYYTPGARIVHHEGQSASLVRPQVREHLFRGRLRLVARHWPWALPFATAWTALEARRERRAASRSDGANGGTTLPAT